MRILFSLLVILLAFQTPNSWSADTVRILNVSTITSITGQTNLSHTIVAEAPSGDGTSESAPAKIYVPMATVTTAPTTDYFYLNSTAGPNHSLFAYTATGASKATYTSYYLSFPLVVSIDSTAKYLYAAVKSAASYVVVAKYGLINPVTNGEVTFNLSPQSICEGAAASTTNCANFDENTPGSISEAIKAVNVYFFASADSLVVGSGDIGAPSATYGGGVFFQVNMSNQVYSNTELYVSLSELRKGDRRVIGNFASSSNITTGYKGTYAYVHNNDSDTCVSVREPGRCQGAFTTDAVSNSQSGEFTLNNLTNGTEVTVSVALVDKFGFSTTLSNSIKATPVEIQELLKKQACFLLTAGFGEEHYVINFFRRYRDHVLAHTWLGRKFIKFYYREAPHYALIIYKSESMRLGIRTMAYILYFLFNYYWLVLLLISSCYFLNFKKNKNLITE